MRETERSEEAEHSEQEVAGDFPPQRTKSTLHAHAPKGPSTANWSSTAKRPSAAGRGLKGFPSQQQQNTPRTRAQGPRVGNGPSAAKRPRAADRGGRGLPPTKKNISQLIMDIKRPTWLKNHLEPRSRLFLQQNPNFNSRKQKNTHSDF